MQIVTSRVPSATRLLEELADRVAIQVDQLSVGGFENTFEELTEFHRFLLDAYATRGPAGQPETYAKLSEGWLPLHREWTRAYRIPIERSVAQLDKSKDFIERILRIPQYLLKGTGSSDTSDIHRAILDITSLTIFRLSSWVARREVSSDNPAQLRKLSPPDHTLYDEVVRSAVGSWEALVYWAPGLSRRNDNVDESTRWERFRESWSFLLHHLESAAGFLAVAVWNRDPVGAEWFRDMLLRWRSQLLVERSGYDRIHGIDWPELLNGDLLRIPWQDARDLVTRRRSASLPPPTPTDVFARILDNLHEDVILLTSSLLMTWALRGTSKELAISEASNLLDRCYSPQGGDPPDRFDAETWSTRHRHWLSMELHSTPAPSNYEGELGGIVRSLDAVTEYVGVSGRIFTPSAAFDRDAVEYTWQMLLVAKLTDEDARQVLDSVYRLSQNEGSLPRGDETLRELRQCAERQRRLLEPVTPEARILISKISSSDDIEGGQKRVAQLHEEIQAAIQRVRTARVQDRPVSAVRLRAVAAKIERHILAGVGTVPVFRGYSVGAKQLSAAHEIYRLRGIQKARLLDVPMETDWPDYEEMIANQLATMIGARVWGEFVGRRRDPISINARPDDTEFWTTLSGLTQGMTGTPTLLLPPDAYSAFSERFLWRSTPDRAAPRFERKEPAPDRRYVGSVSGIDVIATGAKPNEAWLFSSSALSHLAYGTGGEGEVVKLAFEAQADDPWHGTILADFQQEITWAEQPSYSISFPLIEDAGPPS